MLASRAVSNTTSRFAADVLKPFRFGGRINVFVLSLFVAINALVFTNAALHDPRIGYDAHHHLDYAWTLAEGRLPAEKDSYAYFSAPLPYVAPALAFAITGDEDASAKLGQFANAFASVLLTLFLLKTCRLLSPRPTLAVGALLLLGMLPVYYKTFAFIRGECWAACFTVVASYYGIRIFVRRAVTARDALLLGVALGLAALARQWGVLLFPAIGLAAAVAWLRHRRLRRALFLCALLAFATGGLLGGWFYAVLKIREGSAAAFTMKSAPTFSLTNQPASFYLGTGNGQLFRRPVRPAFENQFVPLFYSEMWGDYRCYFAVYGWDSISKKWVTGNWLKRALDAKRPGIVTNFKKMDRYLGRVNLVSLLPSLLLLAGLAAGLAAVIARRTTPRLRDALILLLAAVALTLAGYFWYVIMHRGLAIRATHMLQISPLTALLAGLLLERIARANPRTHRVLVALLLLIALHNLPAMVSHYTFLTARP